MYTFPINASYNYTIKVRLNQWCENSYKDKNVLLLEGDKYKAHLYASIIVATLVIIVITALVRTTAILKAFWIRAW